MPPDFFFFCLCIKDAIGLMGSAVYPESMQKDIQY